MEKKKTVGLALGSGGFRGFAHIGVIRSLEKHGISIDYLSGTSVGAWVAASYAIFKDSDKLENDLTNKPRDNWSMLFDLSWAPGIISGQKFSIFLKKNLENKKFVDVKIPLKIVATDLITGNEHVFEEGDIAQAVRASTSIPLVFKPMLFNDELLVDGGLCNPVPCDIAKKMGADIVIGVNLYSKNEFIKKKLNVANVVSRSGTIGMHYLAQASMKEADVAIEMDISKYTEQSSLAQYFTKEIGDEIIKIGEMTADKFIPQIKALLEK
jgi:NTE family protein